MPGGSGAIGHALIHTRTRLVFRDLVLDKMRSDPAQVCNHVVLLEGLYLLNTLTQEYFNTLPIRTQRHFGSIGRPDHARSVAVTLPVHEQIRGHVVHLM